MVTTLSHHLRHATGRAPHRPRSAGKSLISWQDPGECGLPGHLKAAAEESPGSMMSRPFSYFCGLPATPKLAGPGRPDRPRHCPLAGCSRCISREPRPLDAASRPPGSTPPYYLRLAAGRRTSPHVGPVDAVCVRQRPGITPSAAGGYPPARHELLFPDTCDDHQGSG
jgi:hypothetical protein